MKHAAHCNDQIFLQTLVCETHAWLGDTAAAQQTLDAMRGSLESTSPAIGALQKAIDTAQSATKNNSSSGCEMTQKMTDLAIDNENEKSAERLALSQLVWLNSPTKAEIARQNECRVASERARQSSCYALPVNLRSALALNAALGVC